MRFEERSFGEVIIGCAEVDTEEDDRDETAVLVAATDHSLKDEALGGANETRLSTDSIDHLATPSSTRMQESFVAASLSGNLSIWRCLKRCRFRIGTATRIAGFWPLKLITMVGQIND